MAVDRSRTCAERDVDLVDHAARLHYEFGLTPLEIAARFECSRAHVLGLLERARDLGVVVVEVHTDASPFAELERDLARGFGLEAAIVVPALDDAERRRAAVSRAADAYLRRTRRAATCVAATDEDGDDDEAIRTALAGGQVSVLVTDAATATRLLGTRESAIERLGTWQ
jgi:DNA-binding transcriptional regulator LsrR (DeoR family)